MNTWSEIVNLAVVGTERQAVAPPTADGALPSLLAQLDYADREAALLKAAALTALHERAGRLPQIERQALPAPAAAEEWPRCSARVVPYLTLMLQGRHAELLPEFLQTLAGRQQLVPEELLPSLLERGVAHEALRELIAPVAGARGRWLAQQNPAWRYLLGESADETIWETGTLAERKAFFADLRKRDAVRARELLQVIWEQEPAKTRAEWLPLLAHGLSADHEPFLREAYADKKSAAVRDAALKLLLRLPDSAVYQDAMKQAAPFLELKHSASGQASIKLAKNKSASDWSLIAEAPPRLWCEQWQKTPSELIKIAKSSKLKKQLLENWALAALRCADAAWAEALLPETIMSLTGQELWQILPRSAQESFLTSLLANAPSLQGLEWLLPQGQPVWSGSLSHAMLSCLCQHFQNDTSSLWHEILKRIGSSLNAATLPQAIAALAAALKLNKSALPAYEEFINSLQVRYDMLKELNQ